MSLDGAATKGDRKAKIALIEYSDFQCPFCGRFARETLPQLDEKYVRSGRVLVAFRHLPLPIHALAQKAAEAAECAGEQNKFWLMHDFLFRDSEQLAESKLRNSVPVLGLNDGQFNACLEGQTAAKVRADADMGRALGVTVTPTFLLGSVLADGRVKVERRISGAQGVPTFEAVLDRLLGTVTADSRPIEAPAK